ncbi:hypothetical protein [uncultured Clostridium sp.]|uniref:hypothetical protein n=1 Tax=uncultured Clostridium sp. TaxID=59620 RepID=UPI0027DD0969|nr:hypothetical protein [uncultured Clostridium sp.]
MDINNLESISDLELVKSYKQARQTFVRSIEDSEEEKKAEELFDRYFKEIDERNIDLRDYTKTK